jgi:hypothetical protein
LFLILIFATIAGLAAHYSHLLLECMAVASGGPRRLIAREEDDARLWFGEVLQS